MQALQMPALNLTTSNPFDAKPIESGMLLRFIVLDILATLTFPAGGITLFEDALARNLRVQVLMQGRNPIFSADLDVWNNRCTMVDGVAPDTGTPLTGNAGAETQRMRLVIPFSDPTLPNPDDTIYDLALADNPTIECTWGGLGGISAAAGATTLDALTVTPTLFGLQRPTGLTAEQRNIIRRFKQYGTLTTSELPAGTVDGRFVKLDNGTYLRRVFVQVRNTSTTKARSNDSIERYGWFINGTRFGMGGWHARRALRRMVRPVAPPTGCALEDFDTSGSIDPRELVNLVGVTGTAGLEPQMAAALASGLDVRYLDETVTFPVIAG